MNADLDYLTTEYAREKQIEEYNTPYLPKRGREMKTGKEIVDSWREQLGPVERKDFLEERIDAALREARREGNIQGWEEAQKMANVMLGKP